MAESLKIGVLVRRCGSNIVGSTACNQGINLKNFLMCSLSVRINIPVQTRDRVR